MDGAAPRMAFAPRTGAAPELPDAPRADSAPRLELAPRTGAAVAVAALHLVLVAGLLLVPDVRERLVAPAPLFVEFVEAPPQPLPVAAPRPLPPPTMREPTRVVQDLPTITLAQEPVAPAAAPQVIAPPAPPAPMAEATIVPPRFDMAYLRNPAPAYPGVSRKLKEHGRVILNVLVGAEGDAQSIEVRTSSGYDRLDRAAIDAVRHWRFSPARRGSQTVAAWALVPILFELEA